jgi:PTH1 family peptidyl-tRNA hydrolase
MSVKLIVGLGNPGKEYSASRHNVGFVCINYLAKANAITFDKKQGKARIGTGRIAGNEVVLAKPQTFMNLSGQAVIPLVQRYYLGLDDILIIQDDMDLPLGKIRIRKTGSAGGHNGLKSIIASLGSQDFVRIKVGIGRPELADENRKGEVVDYVLGDFDRDEIKLLERTIPRVTEAVVFLLTDGVEAAMNKFN